MELNSRQIRIVEWDIAHNGIYLPTLKEDVLDHLCCLLEEELKSTTDFRTAYLKVRNQMGSLKVLQYKTDKEILSHQHMERFVNILNYIAVFLYLLLGVGMFAGPLLLSIIELDIIYSVLTLPLIIMGYVIIFTRIDYRKLDVIPYKESFSPVQITF
jgi:hypothetical protein